MRVVGYILDFELTKGTKALPSWARYKILKKNVHVIIRGVMIRRAMVRYVSRYVGRDTTNDMISDDTPTNLESQTHFS